MKEYTQFPPPKAERREFLKQVGTGFLGAFITVVPVLAGLGVLLDPLRRSGGATQGTKIASLDALTVGGPPMKFAVLKDKVDAWNKTPDVPVGAVYLQRVSENEVKAFNTICPHLGCSVTHRKIEKEGQQTDAYFCPCHDSTFLADGSRGDGSPSPRDLDALDVEIKEGEIWVTFQNFKTGIPAKEPQA